MLQYEDNANDEMHNEAAACTARLVDKASGPGGVVHLEIMDAQQTFNIIVVFTDGTLQNWELKEKSRLSLYST